ncbi:MAG: enoyl-CoA hydratase/isomerase family protein [Bacteroidota bacterium]|jgi:methylglutaconyl-CoA hydratase|nr:enoyl-CoA hydratase/isomerase family protein [Terrimonas sp.]
MEKAYVKSSVQHGLCSIEFFHPQSNSLPGALLQELAAAIRDAGKNTDCRLILLRSQGQKAFCAGASFDELSQLKNEQEGLQFFSGFAEVINAMRTCGKIIVGRIHGKCVGGGVGLAAAVDYALATEEAAVKLSELAVGIGPFVVGPAVERKIGLSAFSQLALDATGWRSANWAHERGLFAELYADTIGLDEGINRLVTQLLNSSQEALRALKTVFWSGTDHWDQLLIERAAISGKLILSEASRKAIESFKKR